MEFFKSDVLKKEFDDHMPLLNECGSCNVLKCIHCPKFDVTCSICRLWRCKNCVKFNNSKEILFEKCDQ